MSHPIKPTLATTDDLIALEGKMSGIDRYEWQYSVWKKTHVVSCKKLYGPQQRSVHPYLLRKPLSSDLRQKKNHQIWYHWKRRWPANNDHSNQFVEFLNEWQHVFSWKECHHSHLVMFDVLDCSLINQPLRQAWCPTSKDISWRLEALYYHYLFCIERKPPLTAWGWQQAWRSRNKGFNNYNEMKK